MPMSRLGSVTYMMNYFWNIFVASLFLLYSEAVLNDILFACCCFQVGALQDVRSDLTKLRGVLFYKVLEDLHSHLYNKGVFRYVFRY